ncbi:hypothetical protein [Nocardiopsis algeriensis]|uniref:Uncharacterized protein n=1 Tax=Nocardiopsis algeriensis TaxID=1478215 RepID=A0A841IJE3_9ACTN|nr:hypothetical protein [Nocardiopsis algeriensis]MBB6118162.1 hypothetical protein [Nocardiopsis algeriensis]
MSEPRQVLSADDVALVRPYYEAHEKHVARMRAAFQEDAGPEQKSSQKTQPSRQSQSPQQPPQPQQPQPPQLPEPRIPEGDLLASAEPVPMRGRHHRVDEAELDRELARLTRMWHVQRQNLRAGVPA